MTGLATPQRTPAERPGHDPALRLAGRSRPGERIVMLLLQGCGLVTILTTVGIVVVLFADAGAFFREPVITFTRFFTETAWRPFGSPESPSFAIGVLPLLNGTLLVTGIAMLLAIPLGLATAVYLAEYAPRRVRAWLKPALELLAGVPTVVLGWFAVNTMTPALRTVFGEAHVAQFNAASAGLVMGIMIVPLIASLSEDAMSAVPSGLRESAYGLGAAKRHVVLRIVMPAALSGIVAAIILGIGRAIGETMIVAIAAGGLPQMTANPFEQVQTMTAYIVQAVRGETPRGSLGYESIFAVGALLFLITFALNLVAQRFVRRFREIY